MSEPVIQNEEVGLLAEHLGLLIQELEQDPDADSHVTELLHHTLTFYGEALKRILDLIQSNPTGEMILAQISADELISTVLLIHDLFPVDLETRVQAALDRVRPHLNAHGGDVELLSLEEGVAKLRLIGSGHDFDSSLAAMQLHLRQALMEAAPDLLGIEVEGVFKPQPLTPKVGKLVQITKPKPNSKPASRAWTEVARVEEIPPGRMKAVEIDRTNLLLCNVGEHIYAYRNVCAHQQLPLDKGLLRGSVLTCPWHGYQYDVQQAGACLTDPQLHLDPIPLIVEDGLIKVRI